MATITATDLARHTREVLDQVVSRGEAIAIERNRRVIAEIIPARPTLTLRELLADLRPTLTIEQSRFWLDDSRRGFDESVRDPWG
jgi:antitoxin (DNA-binding transcriptional repressor) of toxin-antitoxin stability system